jgi:hypothetical protein
MDMPGMFDDTDEDRLGEVFAKLMAKIHVYIIRNVSAQIHQSPKMECIARPPQSSALNG